MPFDGCDTLKDRALDFISGLGGIAQLKELTTIGVHSMILRRLLADGELRNPARGIYVMPFLDGSPNLDYAVEALSAPVTSRVCLLTAAYLHGLIARDPRHLMLLIPKATWPPRSVGLLPVTAIPSADLKANGLMARTRRGLDPVGEMQMAGRTFYVTSPARTVADLFANSPALGTETAIEALGTAVSGNVAISEIEEFSEQLGISDAVRPYLSGAGTTLNRRY